MNSNKYTPTQEDLEGQYAEIQNFAFGGIANPSQRARLRSADKGYLDERQKELDAFEVQRQAYNTALEDYQTKVYAPYEKQASAYNTAAEKYNTDVYNPYQQQFDVYNKAIEGYNAGPRTEDYAGPAAPTLPSEFSMAAPTAPKSFEMAAPTLPFKEEEVQAFQKEAAVRAQKDAGGRAVAIDVVSDPSRYNLGSMSVANRFMAEGGEVKGKSAKEMLAGMDGEYEPDDAAILKMAQEISSKGKLTHTQIMEAVDRVSKAGRGGDELLAYLSPASVEILKKMGGSGSINPATGLHEFKGGVLQKIIKSVARVFGGGGAAPAPAAAPAPVAPPTAEEDLARLRGSVSSLEKRLQETPQTRRRGIFKRKRANPAYAEVSNQLTSARGQLDEFMKTYKPTVAAPAPVAATPAAPAAAPVAAAPAAAATPAAQQLAELPMSRSATFEQLVAANPASRTPSPDPMSSSFVGPRTQAEELQFKAGQQPSIALPPPPVIRDPRALAGLAGSAAGQVSTMPSPVENLGPIGSAAPIAPIDFGRPATNIARPSPVNQQPGQTTRPSQGGLDTSYQAPGISQPQFADYTTRGVGTAQQNLSMPMFGGQDQRQQALMATNPGNYFGMSQPSSPGISAGTTAIGSSDMPLYGAMNTMGAIGANKNLSPGMLGGQQNAGVMVDRLGNRIYSPGMNPLFGFAKGGLAEVNEYNASDPEDEKYDPIDTDPAGSAQKMLQGFVSAGKSESPTGKSIKRIKKVTASGGGAESGKEMNLDYEPLTSAKDLVPQLKDKGSARSQMEALALAYKMRAQQATDKSRGLMANTLGAPTLEQPTLTKGTLTAKRFEKGGEAKKPQAEEVSEPSLFGVSDYATKASARMFPDQMGQDDERDAARHMLAAGTVARKYGPKAAEMLGKAHEYTSSPQTFFSGLGIGKPREDLPYDVHNNRVGAELAARTTSQAELEKLVQILARQSATKQTPGRPWVMSEQEMEARRQKAAKGPTPPPEYRADGSPVEGEVSQEEIDAASRPAFVTPKSGKGRKEGPISQALKSGEAYSSMAKGVTELPYDIAGAPVDLATMAMRPFGYGTEKPVMGSDWIKEKMTGAGVRPEPPTDATQKGFYTAGELLSNLTNPAGVTRAGVKGAQKAGQAATDVAKDFQEYNRQLTVPGASYAVRPTGSTMLTGPVGLNKNVSEVDQLLQNGVSNAKSVAGQNEGQQKLIEDFWGKKARNYFERQFGTPDDPIMEGIKTGALKGTALSSDLRSGFPRHLINSMAQGKSRSKEAARPTSEFVGPGKPEERFFPEYPESIEEFTQRYDQATGLRGNLISTNPAAADPSYSSISTEGRAMGRAAAEAESDKMLNQGMRPELINPEVGVTTRSVKDPERIIGDNSSRSARDLYTAFEESSAYNKMTPEQQLEWANSQYGSGRSELRGMDPSEVGPNLLGENVRTAIEKGEPVYDINYMGKPLQSLFKPDNINEYLASLPPRELANIRFEDAVRGGLKIGEKQFKMQGIVDRIKSGKPVADSVFSDGVSKPLLQFGEGSGLDGFAWKRIEKREATVPEGAYVGHSVGGYELGGPTYTSDKRNGFNTGAWQVYTLRDNRNKPVNTIEVKMVDENTPVVTQIKGNGRATGNTAPEKYDGAVLKFLRDYLKPSAIQESDSYLTPLLQNYKTELGASPRAR